MQYSTFDFCDDRLQLVEEAIEPAGQFTQFVVARILQTLRQVAFATGDIAQHGGDSANWPADTSCGKPHQQKAKEAGCQP